MSHHHRNRLASRRWEPVRRAAFERDGWRCVDCGRPGRLEAHHIQPLHRNGPAYDLANIRTLCRGCHIERHRRKLAPAEAAWAKLVAELC